MTAVSSQQSAVSQPEAAMDAISDLQPFRDRMHKLDRNGMSTVLFFLLGYMGVRREFLHALSEALKTAEETASKVLVVAAALLLFAAGSPMHAQSQSATIAAVPDAPAPHRFMDRSNAASFAVMVAARAADTANTCRVLNGRYGHEQWLPAQSCAGVAGFSAMFAAVGVGSAALLHRWRHHKWERWAMPLSAAGAAVGMVNSARQHAWKL